MLELPPLFDYQRRHVFRLSRILAKDKVALDCSITGSGKTITSLFLANEMFMRELIDNIIVICPPTLISNWTSKIKDNCEFEVFSCFQLAKVKILPFTLLIVDECHYFKNNSKRSQLLKGLINKSEKVLGLSATPMDDVRQKTHINSLFLIHGDIKEQTSQMKFDYNTKTTFYIQKMVLTKEENEDYSYGLNAIAMSSRRNEDDLLNVFKPAVFSAGIQSIHSALIEPCIRFIKQCLVEYPTHKIVVVLQFMAHYSRIKQEIPNVLILNGLTNMKNRASVIAKFQQDNLDNRVILVSSVVGSVGIELDDKTGNHPRIMVFLPVPNMIDFFQSIGRVQRTQTRSNSKVFMIQNVRTKKGYFVNSFNRKSTVLQNFMKIPNFITRSEHYEDCPAFTFSNIINLPKDIVNKVCEFSCSCIQKKLN